MPTPSMGDFLLPCLRLLAGDARNTRDCLPALRVELGLTEEDMAEVLKSGTRTRVFDRADWAVQHLVWAGLVERPERGVHRASVEGRAWLAEKKPLDLRIVRAIPAHQAAMTAAAERRAGKEAASPATSSANESADQTPEDMIDRATKEAETALVEDVIQRLLAMHPTRFEQLIVDLLLKMGYGGGDRSMGERIGKSGDGGIDGIINEDALGLDAVYVQAKRYAPDSKVGRPALQAFVGSLTGEGANKGVFVTTSDFSREAREYLNKVQHRIVLINGERLARLMIQHEVGVRARRSFVIRSVDEDYFADPEG